MIKHDKSCKTVNLKKQYACYIVEMNHTADGPMHTNLESSCNVVYVPGCYSYALLYTILLKILLLMLF